MDTPEYSIIDIDSSDDLFTDIGFPTTDTWNELGIENIEIFETHPCWYEKPMGEWESKDVLDFIYNSMPEEVPCNMSHFQSISGNIFQTLSEEYCKILAKSSIIGHTIYIAKQRHLEEEYNKRLGIRSSFSTTDNEETEQEQQLSKKTTRKIGRPRARPLHGLGKRNEKLWEFLIHLLQAPATCPDLIRWENFEEGTFKFVKSDKVARLWGMRKLNSNMTYEKFSRAMRYYYKSQVLLPVPSKRLVYKFGPFATGWNAMPPIQ